MLTAVEKGDAKELAELMRQNPGFSVNQQGVDRDTLLHHACKADWRSAVIPLLLAHPDIDVNSKNVHGSTPFYIACFYERPSCVRELLKDAKEKVNECNNHGYTPLWLCRLDIIKLWIASGREIDLGKPGDVDKTDAIGIAQKRGKTRMVTLLERFKSDAAKTRSEVRKELESMVSIISFFSID